MPPEGFKTITVSAKLYKDLETLAVETHLKIPQAIAYLVEQHARKVKS